MHNEISFTVDDKTSFTRGCYFHNMDVIDFWKLTNLQDTIKNVYVASFQVLDVYSSILNISATDLVKKYKLEVKEITDEKPDVTLYCSCLRHMYKKNPDSQINETAMLKPSQYFIFKPDTLNNLIGLVDTLVKDDIENTKERYEKILKMSAGHVVPNVAEVIEEIERED